MRLVVNSTRVYCFIVNTRNCMKNLGYYYDGINSALSYVCVQSGLFTAQNMVGPW
jgi:hypothetical protein